MVDSSTLDSSVDAVSDQSGLSSDIVIVGGGMVGTPLALMLAQQGWQVTLLDAADNATQSEKLAKQKLEQRCTAISAGSAQLLEAVGLWEAAMRDACPIEKVHVSQRGYFGTVRMQASQHKLDALGYVVNNETYLATLRNRLSDSAVTHITSARAVSYSATDLWAEVGYEVNNSKHRIAAKLVIAVDGVASAMRDAVGIGIRHHNYEQCAVLGCVELEQPHDNTAYERFSTGGPLALLPRTGNIASFVYCIDAKLQKQIAALDSQAFIDRLQSEFGHRLGTFNRVGKRTIFPLTRIEAQVQQRDRLLLLGNAMRLLHPVAGQGYNLAMRDVAGLLQTFEPSITIDPGSAALLADFAARRESDQKRIVKLTDSLARGFRGYSSLPGHIRGAGLLTMAAVPQLSQLLTKQGLGFVRPLPIAR